MALLHGWVGEGGRGGLVPVTGREEKATAALPASAQPLEHACSKTAAAREAATGQHASPASLSHSCGPLRCPPSHLYASHCQHPTCACSPCFLPCLLSCLLLAAHPFSLPLTPCMHACMCCSAHIVPAFLMLCLPFSFFTFSLHVLPLFCCACLCGPTCLTFFCCCYLLYMLPVCPSLPFPVPVPNVWRWEDQGQIRQDGDREWREGTGRLEACTCCTHTLTCTSVALPPPCLACLISCLLSFACLFLPCAFASPLSLLPPLSLPVLPPHHILHLGTSFLPFTHLAPHKNIFDGRRR